MWPDRERRAPQIFVGHRRASRAAGTGLVARSTRAYSPTMLERVLGWNMDLPQWDGFCCSIANAKYGAVLDVQIPLGPSRPVRYSPFTCSCSRKVDPMGARPRDRPPRVGEMIGAPP